jgi:DNA-directed RNA polymerase specialized sigma24 family protein
MSQLLRMPHGRRTPVATAADNQRTVLEDAWHRHGTAVFALALVLSDDSEDAEAVVVQAFLDACTPADIAVAAVSRHEMARYVYVLWLRRMAEPRARADVKVRRSQMPVLRGMTHPQRTAIALALFGEHTYQEIASLMQLTPKDVAALMRSGLLAASVG